eukprot:Phypoly_transcript_11915.p1 GENE.Phypoly_transcript_11915~~Phypoly_transcript_11915.p1  ORF type:complete len:224 (+),score=13.41 Phypoly_transcript_11915:98-769(+)
MLALLVIFKILLLVNYVACAPPENVTSITLLPGVNCGGCAYNTTLFVSLGPHQSKLYSMELNKFIMGHTDALEIEVLESVPDLQDTLMGLNYKVKPEVINDCDVVSDCGVDAMVKCKVGMCNPNKASYYLFIENLDGYHVSMLTNVLIHKSSSMSCSVMPLYWVAVVAIFIACSIVIVGAVIWIRRWYKAKHENERAQAEYTPITVSLPPFISFSWFSFFSFF